MHTCVGQKCRKGMMRDKEEFNVRKGTRQDNKEEEREKEKKLTLIQVFYNTYIYIYMYVSKDHRIHFNRC